MFAQAIGSLLTIQQDKQREVGIAMDIKSIHPASHK